MDLATDYCHRSMIVMIRSFNERVFVDPSTAYPFVGFLSLAASETDSAKLLFAAGLECLPQDALEKSKGLDSKKKGGGNLPLKWDGTRATVQQVEDMTAEEAVHRQRLLQRCSFIALSFSFASSGVPGSRSYSDASRENTQSHRFLIFLARASRRLGPWKLFVADTAHDLDERRLLDYIVTQLERFLPTLRVISEGYDPWLPISTPNTSTLKYRGGGLCFYGPCADLKMMGAMLDKKERVEDGVRLAELVRRRVRSVESNAYPLVAKHAILNLLTLPGQVPPVASLGEMSAATLARNLPSIMKDSWQWDESSRGPTTQTEPFHPSQTLLTRIEDRQGKKRREDEEGIGARMTYKKPRFGRSSREKDGGP